MADRPMTHGEIDRQVRQQLVGCRLVCEVDWSEDLLLEVRKAWFSQRSYRPSKFVVEYPALGALYLVEHGIRNYATNEFWPALKLGGSEQSRVGEAFEQALATLDLETFAQFSLPSEKAKRFVAPILAHGGIPASMAGPFLRETLFPALRRGHGNSGAELVARWRRDPPPVFRSPVRRFLLYGGKTAVDLLDRLIALAAVPRADLEAGSGVNGLPHHLVRAFLEVPPAEVVVARTMLPRPRIELDPWGEDGPVLHLPPVGRELGANLVWLVEDGTDTTKTIPGYPRRDLEPVPLFPAAEWRVTAKTGAETLVDRTYECFDDNPIVCFDLDGTYLPDAGGIRADQAWVLAGSNVRLASVESGGLRELTGETRQFRGAWSGRRVQKIDLRGVDLLATLEGDSEIARIPILRAALAELVWDPLRDVLSQEGYRVVAEVPAISLPSKTAWTVRVTGPSGLAEFVHAAQDLRVTIPLVTLIPSKALGRYEVIAEGPLGSDFRESFVLVPGLVVETPNAPVMPTTPGIVVRIRTTSREIKLQGKGPGEPLDLDFASGGTREELWVFGRDHQSKVGLFVTIPRVRWAFRVGDAALDFGTSTRSFEPDRLGEDPASLLVAVDRPDIPVRLVLNDATGGSFEVGYKRTDSAGRFWGELMGLRDTARALAHLDLRLELNVGTGRILVASYQPPRPTIADDPRPQMGATVAAVVSRIDGRALTVDGDSWTGIALEDHLPKPLSEYKVGMSFVGTVIGYDAHVKLDGRPFDASRFAVGGIVTGRVIKAIGDGLLVRAYGHDLRVDHVRLPAGRAAASWHAGDEITGKVVYINADKRLIRLSVASFDPGSLRPGDEVEGVVYSPGNAIILRLGALVGFVPPGEGPDVPVHSGDSIRGRVTQIDHKRDQIVVTCRRFNAAGHRVGDIVTAEVANVHDGDVWVRLPGGDSARVPTAHVPPHLGAADLEPRTSVSVRIIAVDDSARRIVASIGGASDGYTFGDDAAPDSPFNILKDMRKPGTTPKSGL